MGRGCVSVYYSSAFSLHVWGEFPNFGSRTGSQREKSALPTAPWWLRFSSSSRRCVYLPSELQSWDSARLPMHLHVYPGPAGPRAPCAQLPKGFPVSCCHLRALMCLGNPCTYLLLALNYLFSQAKDNSPKKQTWQPGTGARESSFSCTWQLPASQVTLSPAGSPCFPQRPGWGPPVCTKLPALCLW